jgi:hypothetical protein
MSLDGNWVDITSILITILVGFHRPLRRRIFRGKWHCLSQEIIGDLLSGSSIMPFLLMLGSVFSSQILKTALETNKLYMGIAGLIGLVVIAYEIMKPGVLGVVPMPSTTPTA